MTNYMSKNIAVDGNIASAEVVLKVFKCNSVLIICADVFARAVQTNFF